MTRKEFEQLEYILAMYRKAYYEDCPEGEVDNEKRKIEGEGWLKCELTVLRLLGEEYMSVVGQIRHSKESDYKHTDVPGPDINDFI